MQPTIHLVLAVFLTQAAAIAGDSAEARSTARKEAEKRFQLRIDKTGWGNAGHADLSAVLRSACSELAVHIGEDLKLEPIRVRRDDSGPIVWFKRTLKGEIMMLLSSKDRYWAQHAYQVSHEFCHVLCRFKEGDRSNLWFEEALCELASIFALREMAKTWTTHPPYPNWKDFAKALRSYADDVAKKHALPEDADFRRWFEENAAALAEKADDRAKNAKVAVKLLPLIEKEPRFWKAVSRLNAGRGEKVQSFREYLANWHAHCPTDDRSVVASIASIFGIDGLDSSDIHVAK